MHRFIATHTPMVRYIVICNYIQIYSHHIIHLNYSWKDNKRKLALLVDPNRLIFFILFSNGLKWVYKRTSDIADFLKSRFKTLNLQHFIPVLNKLSFIFVGTAKTKRYLSCVLYCFDCYFLIFQSICIHSYCLIFFF